MGSIEEDAQDDDEKPQHTLHLPQYWIGRYPVTNEEYELYARSHSICFTFEFGKELHPVDAVNWHDAQDYCCWLSAQTGRKYRLPSEAEREKASRCTDGRIYPWGNTWQVELANTDEYWEDETLLRQLGLDQRERGTTPVVFFSPAGDSPYGCADMAGNV